MPAKPSTKNNWDLIAEHEPYFGVISSPQYRSGAKDDDAVERYYASEGGAISILILVSPVSQKDLSPEMQRRRFSGIVLRDAVDGLWIEPPAFDRS